MQLSFHFLDSHLGFIISEQQYINLLLVHQRAQARRWMERIGVKPSLKKFGLVDENRAALGSMIHRLHNFSFGNWFGIYSKHLLHFCLYYWARFSLSWICAQSRNRAYKTKHKESSAAHSRQSSGNTYSCYDFILDSGDLCFRKMNSYFLTKEKLGSNIL